MGLMAVRKLTDQQVQTFADNDYVTDELFAGICAAIVRDFPEGRFSFLDVGGGRGLFADRLLARFPNAEATVLDNSDLLLSLNTAHSRKRLVAASATEIVRHFGNGSFDIAFLNLSLHHFVAGSYGASRTLQRRVLKQVVKVLSPRGRVVVTENLFQGVFLDDLAGMLIYVLTSSKLLAPIIKRFGANTAGCGVCFLSESGWRREFRATGLRELSFYGQRWRESEFKRRVCLRLLGVRSVSRSFFWLAPPAA